MLIAPATFAQSAGEGTIKGRVYNTGTGNYVEGAEVSIIGATVPTSTDSLGRFVLTGVAAGNVHLVVNYRGLADGSADVVVPAGGTVTVPDIALGDEDIIVMSDFVVQAEVEGQAKIIAQQRDAPNVVTSIATDAYGNVGSNSVGNLLQYMPGLTTEGFDGEAFTVSVRGMDPAYGSVTTDGAQLASNAPGGINRATYVLDIGLVNFSEIEVIKAPTPDKEANSTGGVINLKSRSVFASKTPRSGKLTVGASAPLREGFAFHETSPSFTLNYRQLMGGEDAKWGFAVNASSNERYVLRDQTNTNYETSFTTVNPDYPYVSSVVKQVGGQVSIRRSAGARLEFRPSDASLFSLGVTYNYSSRANDNNERTFSASGTTLGTPVLPSGYESGSSYTGPVRITNGYTEDEMFWPRGQIVYRNVRTEHNTDQIAYRFAGEHTLGDWKIDYDANYSDYDTVQQYSGDFGGQTRLTFNNVGMRVTGLTDGGPNWDVEPVGGIDPKDLSKFASLTFDDWNQNQFYSSVFSSKLNVSRMFDIEGAPTLVKAGLSFRSEEKSQLPTVYNRYTFVGNKSTMSSDRISINSPNARGFPYNTVADDWDIFWAGIVDSSALRADIFDTNPQDWSNPVANNAGNVDRQIQEDISAAYVMATTQLFDRRLTVLGGLRVERTDITARDELVADPVEGTPYTEGKSTYDDAFPSLHATWRFSKSLQGRLSYSTSIGRPNPGSIIPRTTITPNTDPDDVYPGRVSVVNVGLKPRYVDNFDAALEFYPQQGGRVSIGFFRKDMTSFIYGISEVIGAGPDNGFDGDYEGWELVTQANGGRGQVQGWEFDYQSPSLGKLMPALQGFNVFANYTRLKATGDYGDAGSGALTGFKPETANAGIGWRRNGTSIRLRANFRGEYLRFYNADPERQRWEYDQLKFDVNLERKLTDKMSIYVDLINVSNTKGKRYWGSPEVGKRLAWVDNNGPEFYAGLNLVF